MLKALSRCFDLDRNQTHYHKLGKKKSFAICSYSNKKQVVLRYKSYGELVRIFRRQLSA